MIIRLIKGDEGTMKKGALPWCAGIILMILSCSQDIGTGGAARAIAEETTASTEEDIQSLDLESLTSFRYFKTIQPDQLVHDPTGEQIFPMVIRADEHLSSPLGRYYMYYAPHDAPGGINLAYADNIEGPYTDYSGNPIVSKTFEGINVSHVSGPHVIWADQYGKYLMYFHGENNTNRWAYSVDGISWEYGGIALQASQFGSGYTEAQYARVYEYEIPGVGNRYIMLHMLLEGTGNGRKIGLSISNDGKSFTPYDADLILPGADGATNLSGASMAIIDGRYMVLYHTSTGDMCATEVGDDFSMENHLGIFYRASNLAPENDRAAAPFLYTEGTSRYMFYEAGQRGSTKLALAKVMDSSWANLFEAEDLPVSSYGADQYDFYEAAASGGGGNKLDSDSNGDYVEYQADLPAAGQWNIVVRVKKQSSRGKFRLYLPQAGKYVGEEQDGYSTVNKYTDLDMGRYNFNSSGTKNLRFVVTGRNENSTGSTLAIDSILFYR